MSILLSVVAEAASVLRPSLVPVKAVVPPLREQNIGPMRKTRRQVRRSAERQAERQTGMPGQASPGPTFRRFFRRSGSFRDEGICFGPCGYRNGARGRSAVMPRGAYIAARCFPRARGPDRNATGCRPCPHNPLPARGDGPSSSWLARLGFPPLPLRGDGPSVCRPPSGALRVFSPPAGMARPRKFPGRLFAGLSPLAGTSCWDMGSSRTGGLA